MLLTRLMPRLCTPKVSRLSCATLQEFYSAAEGCSGRNGGPAGAASGTTSPVAVASPVRLTQDRDNAARDPLSSNASPERRPAEEPSDEPAAVTGRGAQPGPAAEVPGAASSDARDVLADVMYAWMLAEAFLPNPLLHADMRCGARPGTEHALRPNACAEQEAQLAACMCRWDTANWGSRRLQAPSVKHLNTR